MNASGRQEKHIALAHIILRQSIANSVFLHHILIFLWRKTHLQAAIQLGTGIRFHDIPHLCLAAFLALPFGNLVGGMHLYGQVQTCVDKLYQQRKLVAIVLIHGLSHELVLHLRYKLAHRHTVVRATKHHSLLASHSGNLPTLANGIKFLVNALKRNYLVAAPYCLFQQRLKLKYIHIPNYFLNHFGTMPATQSCRLYIMLYEQVRTNH